MKNDLAVNRGRQVSSPTQAQDELELLSRRIRFKLIEMSHKAGTPHLGSAMSCVDILVATYFGVARIDPRRPDDPLRR